MKVGRGLRRPRGLKFLQDTDRTMVILSRSAKTSWIEMDLIVMIACGHCGSRSAKTSWIEICD